MQACIRNLSTAVTRRFLGRLALSVATVLSVAACPGTPGYYFEWLPEGVTVERAAQFEDKALEEVITAIGHPSEKSAVKAVWFHEEPIRICEASNLPYSGSCDFNCQLSRALSANCYTEGYRRCTLTATLEEERVVEIEYRASDGFICERFAPKLVD